METLKPMRPTLAAHGAIELDGKAHSTSSAAAESLRQRATNGWDFRGEADGRQLRDVRAEFHNSVPADEQLEFEA